jgi:hypothetical protein
MIKFVFKQAFLGMVWFFVFSMPVNDFLLVFEWLHQQKVVQTAYQKGFAFFSSQKKNLSFLKDEL